MAAAFVKSTGLTSTNSATTTTYVFGSAPAATTNTVIVHVNSTATLTNGSFTDSQLGTYTIDKSASDGGANTAYIARRTNALSTGTAITVIVTGSAGSFFSGCANEYSGVDVTGIITGTSGSGTSSPFTATLPSALNAGDLAVASAEADDNTATQGISDPPTGGTATWTTRAAQQDTSTSESIVAADLISAGGIAESAITSCNTTTARIGIIVGYKSAGATDTLMAQILT